MNPADTAKEDKRRVWMTCWGFSLVMPFFSSWFYSFQVWHDGGLHFHPEYPIPIYVMSSLAAVVGVWAVFSFNLRWWAKFAICLGSVGVQILLTFLGMLFEIVRSGLGYNGG